MTLKVDDGDDSDQLKYSLMVVSIQDEVSQYYFVITK